MLLYHKKITVHPNIPNFGIVIYQSFPIGTGIRIFKISPLLRAYDRTI